MAERLRVRLQTLHDGRFRFSVRVGSISPIEHVLARLEAVFGGATGR